LARLHVEPGKASEARLHAEAQKAKFISRLLFGRDVFDSDGKPLNLLARPRQQPTGLLDQKPGGATDRKKDPSHAQLIEDLELLDWLCP
jgi:hypothetical protein